MKIKEILLEEFKKALIEEGYAIDFSDDEEDIFEKLNSIIDIVMGDSELTDEEKDAILQDMQEELAKHIN